MSSSTGEKEPVDLETKTRSETKARSAPGFLGGLSKTTGNVIVIVGLIAVSFGWGVSWATLSGRLTAADELIRSLQEKVGSLESTVDLQGKALSEENLRLQKQILALCPPERVDLASLTCKVRPPVDPLPAP